MGATIVSSSNDTKKIASNMKDLDGLISQANSNMKAIQKAAADVSKSPDKCKDAINKLNGVVAGLAGLAKDMDKLVKDTAKSVVN